MAELPYALMSHCGGTSGFPEQYEPVVRKHFQIVYLEEFLNNKTVFASKIKAILLWWHRPTVNKELLKLLPNLKVIGSSGAGVDHLDLQLIASYGIKVTNTPHVGNDATADMGMALMLASAKNIMEGKVVDQDALVEALENRTIKAAALDVTDPEPLPRNHPLLTMKNVILTPHIGNASDKTRRKVAEKLATNASDIIKGLPIIDIVTAP
ncbi:D-3-phosphoglycerate dehydrogenase [Xenopus laevis]|uniref:D-3-phosphoglycerate dehydrogenase n=1 Tax=Xenopus laevis TaxID=8355 RepID=A0A8J1KY91_XENLA|nr:D-3-phosphoglycerate dehydrogenase [Xenopus laevis]